MAGYFWMWLRNLFLLPQHHGNQQSLQLPVGVGQQLRLHAPYSLSLGKYKTLQPCAYHFPSLGICNRLTI